MTRFRPWLTEIARTRWISSVQERIVDWATNSHPNLWTKMAAEMTGCMFFHFLGSVSATASTNSVCLMVMVYYTAKLSGGHLNPALTTTFALLGYTNPLEVVLYWLAQFVGSIVGALWLAALIPGLPVGTDVSTASAFDASHAGCFVPIPGLSDASVFGWEAIGTFCFILPIFSVVWYTQRKSGYGNTGPIIVGLSLYATASAIGQFTGAALNPARALASAVVFRCPHSERLWAYVAGEFVGAMVVPLAIVPWYGVAAASSSSRSEKDDGEDEGGEEEGTDGSSSSRPQQGPVTPVPTRQEQSHIDELVDTHNTLEESYLAQMRAEEENMDAPKGRYEREIKRIMNLTRKKSFLSARLSTSPLPATTYSTPKSQACGDDGGGGPELVYKCRTLVNTKSSLKTRSSANTPMSRIDTSSPHQRGSPVPLPSNNHGRSSINDERSSKASTTDMPAPANGPQPLYGIEIVPIDPNDQGQNDRSLFPVMEETSRGGGMRNSIEEGTSSTTIHGNGADSVKDVNRPKSMSFTHMTNRRP